MNPDQRFTTPTPPAESSGPPGEGPNAVATGSRLSLRFSKKKLALAFAIALISDALGAFVTMAPPLVWTLDVVTAVLLFAVLGWQWLLLPGLVLEAIPGVSVAPLWLLVVVAIAVWGTARPKMWLRSEPGPKS
jgi:hypothetical protein